MGTRADFYVGKENPETGAKAEWLGSIAWDGYPSGIDDTILEATTEEEFRTAVKVFFAKRDDVTLPERGWPWPWDTSHTTDYAYAFDGDHVDASNFGRAWFKASDDEPYDAKDMSEDEIADAKADGRKALEGPRPVFPDMAALKKVRLDRGSGVIVLGVKG